MKKVFFAVLAGSCMFSACKKNDEMSTSDLITGRWKLMSWSFYSADTIGYHLGAFALKPERQPVEFTKNGKICNHWGTNDTVSYRIINSKQFVIDRGDSKTDTFQIHKLTTDSLNIWRKEIRKPGYIVHSIAFKK